MRRSIAVNAVTSSRVNGTIVVTGLVVVGGDPG